MVCFNPCKKMVESFTGEGRGMRRFGGKEGRKLNNKYEPIQENPYDELKGKIQDVISNNEKDDVEGI